jgi:hypothetical protein
MHTRRQLVFFVTLFAVVAGIAFPVLAAFSNPLSTTAIRDAYFIGNRRDYETRDFLAKYEREFPQPADPEAQYVARIGIDTPFTEVVKHSEAALNYHAPDAVEEFANKPLNFKVNVEVAFNSEYPTVTGDAPRLAQLIPDFWNDYKIRLSQGKEIAPVTVRGGPIYAYGWEYMPLVTGARIQAIYDPANITADPITVEVVAPDGQTVETSFNLATLR